MENIILGFLLMKNLSQYEIKKALEKKPSPFISASLGSIQAALKKLLAKGHITMQATMENGRKKNIYQITDSGKNSFHEWMLMEIDEYNFDHLLMTKLFFLGLLPLENQQKFVNNIINQLNEINKELRSVAVSDELLAHPLAKFQFKTLDLACENYKQTLKFFTNLKKELEN